MSYYSGQDFLRAIGWRAALYVVIAFAPYVALAVLGFGVVGVFSYFGRPAAVLILILSLFSPYLKRGQTIGLPTAACVVVPFLLLGDFAFSVAMPFETLFGMRDFRLSSIGAPGRGLPEFAILAGVITVAYTVLPDANTSNDRFWDRYGPLGQALVAAAIGIAITAILYAIGRGIPFFGDGALRLPWLRRPASFLATIGSLAAIPLAVSIVVLLVVARRDDRNGTGLTDSQPKRHGESPKSIGSALPPSGPKAQFGRRRPDQIVS